MNQSEPVIIIATHLSAGSSGELVYLLHHLIENLNHHAPPDPPQDFWHDTGIDHPDPEDHSDIPF